MCNRIDSIYFLGRRIWSTLGDTFATSVNWPSTRLTAVVAPPDVSRWPLNHPIRIRLPSLCLPYKTPFSERKGAMIHQRVSRSIGSSSTVSSRVKSPIKEIYGRSFIATRRSTGQDTNLSMGNIQTRAASFASFIGSLRPERDAISGRAYQDDK